MRAALWKQLLALVLGYALCVWLLHMLLGWVISLLVMGAIMFLLGLWLDHRDMNRREDELGQMFDDIKARIDKELKRDGHS